jgi:gamma-glutamylcyclotransferase (GGCT)/AIG2-like uncharacterized protein YtfP
LTFFLKKVNIKTQLKTILRTLYGSKVEFVGLSRQKGIVWVKSFEVDNHILISDLDEESKTKLNQIIENELNPNADQTI